MSFTNTLRGSATRTEARQNQLQKYNEDKQNYQQKQKQKEQKKREEKWKRYSHVNVGQQLGSSASSSTELGAARVQQQENYSVESLHSYIRGLELENERLKTEKEKREREKWDKKHERYSHVDVGTRLNGSSNMQDNDRGRSEEAGPSNGQTQQRTEIDFQREMRLAREKLQQKYDTSVKRANQQD